jgi:hypothetical protein
MSRSKKPGPSDCLLLWTLYVLQVLAATVAIRMLMTGDRFTEAGATVLLWRVVKTLMDLARR